MNSSSVKIVGWTLGLALSFCAMPMNAQTGTITDIEFGECEQEVGDIALRSFEKAKKEFNKNNLREAERYLNSALRRKENYADALHMLAEISIRKRNGAAADKFWTQVIKICPEYKAEIYFFIGMRAKMAGQMSKATEHLTKFLTFEERDRTYDKEAEKALKEAKILNEILSNPVAFNPKPVRGISTRNDEYLGIISPDEEWAFYTRKVPVKDLNSVSRGRKMVEEFTFSISKNRVFDKGAPMPYPFNEPGNNEGGPSVSANNKELFFTICKDNASGYRNCDIYYTRKVDGRWEPIQNLGPEVNAKDAWDSQPSISADGQTLYFASNRKGGMGELDIYISRRNLDGSWGKAENAGPIINTPESDKTPFIHSDSETLYFTSKGHPGLGGYDIFLSKFENGKWLEPKNIGYPINSKDDDLALFVSLDGKTAYFSSNKLRGNGGWDMYGFELYEEARPDKVSLLKGSLLDKNNNPVTNAKIELKNLKTQEVQEVKVDQYSGEYVAVVKREEDMIMTVKKKGSAFNSQYIAKEDDGMDGVVKVDLEVKPIEVGEEYRINNINFSTDSYELDHIAIDVITEFMGFLKENPNVKVGIHGHTDNVGNPSANKTLSNNRAKAVYNYLVSNGIPASRLSYKGFGDTKPIASNKTEAGRAQNRRTVFVVTGK